MASGQIFAAVLASAAKRVPAPACGCASRRDDVKSARRRPSAESPLRGARPDAVTFAAHLNRRRVRLSHNLYYVKYRRWTSIEPNNTIHNDQNSRTIAASDAWAERRLHESLVAVVREIAHGEIRCGDLVVPAREQGELLLVGREMVA